MAIDRGIRVISYLKLFKSFLLVVSGIGLLKLLNKNVADVVIHWMNTLHVDPDNRHFHKLLLKASVVNERQLKELSIGSFFYAGLFLTEGSALLLQKRWAKYFTLIITASFIPLELWEVQRSFSAIKTAVIAVNVAMFGIWRPNSKLTGPLTIADGYHRLCTVDTFNEDAHIPCKVV